jgi:hypothetical protein
VDRASGVNRPAERLSIGITVGAQGVRKRREVMAVAFRDCQEETGYEKAPRSHLLEQSERMDDDPRTSSGRQHGSKQNQ